MKLFYYPGACSLAPHSVLHEAGYTFDIESVDPGSGRTAGGSDCLTVNPKGYVPALAPDDGGILTEVTALLLYLAEHRPEAALAPAAGTPAYYRLLEWPSFIASELHKTPGALFNPAITPE